MRDYVDLHRKLTKPLANELDKRNRESGLLGAIKIYDEDPPLGNLTAQTAWISLARWPRLKCYDGSQVLVLSSSGVSVDRGDANITLTLDDAPTQYFRTTLTANRTITLPPDGQNGDHFDIVRTATGAFTLAVGSLLTIPSSTKAYVRIEHDGLGWYLCAYSTLP